MTEALINNLARIRALRVISRTSVMRYKGSQKSLPEIARELNVDAVIEGTVQQSGGRVRVTAQLIHPATDTHLWARDYERDLTDVLKLESEVARAVADEIRIQVTAEERARLASARSVNPQAHEAYRSGGIMPTRTMNRAGNRPATTSSTRSSSTRTMPPLMQGSPMPGVSRPPWNRRLQRSGVARAGRRLESDRAG